MKNSIKILLIVYLCFIFSSSVKAIKIDSSITAGNLNSSISIVANGTNYEIANYNSSGSEFIACSTTSGDIKVSSIAPTDANSASSCTVSSTKANISKIPVKVYLNGGVDGSVELGTIYVTTLGSDNKSSGDAVTDVDSNTLKKGNCSSSKNASIVADGQKHQIGQIVKTGTSEYGSCESNDSRVTVTSDSANGICYASTTIPNLSNIKITLKYYNGVDSGTCVGTINISTTKSSTETENSSSDSPDVLNLCDASVNPQVMAAFKLGSILILIVKIIVPILLIVFGMIDMAKIVVDGKDDSIQKSA
jgi:hypothetical protein